MNIFPSCENYTRQIKHNRYAVEMSMNVNENEIWNALERLIFSSLVIWMGTWIWIDEDCGSGNGTSFLVICFLNVIGFGFVTHAHHQDYHVLHE